MFDSLGVVHSSASMCYQNLRTVLLFAERFFILQKAIFFVVYINFTDGKAVNIDNPQGSFMCKMHKAWMLCRLVFPLGS